MMRHHDSVAIKRLCQRLCEEHQVGQVLGPRVPGHEAGDMAAGFPIFDDTMIIEALAGDYHRVLGRAVESVVRPQCRTDKADAIDDDDVAREERYLCFCGQRAASLEIVLQDMAEMFVVSRYENARAEWS